MPFLSLGPLLPAIRPKTHSGFSNCCLSFFLTLLDGSAKGLYLSAEPERSDNNLSASQHQTIYSRWMSIHPADPKRSSHRQRKTGKSKKPKKICEQA